MSSTMNKLMSVYDFRLSCDAYSHLEIIDSLKEFAKEYTFQKEKGEKTGYLHFQGRIKLKVRKRYSTIKKFKPECFAKVKWLLTSNASKNNDFYVTKEDTRVEGPWSTEDGEEPQYIPRQIREVIKLYPFQEKVHNSCFQYDPRTINIVLDPMGNLGKSIVCQYLDVYKKAVMVPPINDYKDMIQYCMSRRRTPAYLIDMPRALKKDKLYSFYSAIETLKSGFLFDLRYKGRVKHIDRPVVWVFTNNIPNRKYLSQDMWKFYKIVNKDLVEYDPEEPETSDYQFDHLDQ